MCRFQEWIDPYGVAVGVKGRKKKVTVAITVAVRMAKEKRAKKKCS